MSRSGNVWDRRHGKLLLVEGFFSKVALRGAPHPRRLQIRIERSNTAAIDDINRDPIVNTLTFFRATALW